MTIVQQTSLIRLHFIDNDLTKTHCQVQFPTAVAGATLQGLVSSWAALVQALSSAVLVEVEVILRWGSSAIGTPGPASNVRRSGVFIIENAASDLAVVRVPSVDTSFILTTGPYADIWLDRSLFSVSIVETALTAGIDGTEPCDIEASDLVTVTNAFIEQY